MREAERRLIVAGVVDVGQRVSILRGIYYGTTWSNDYRVERSEVRNQGFRVYTATLIDPMNPTALFICGLFHALQTSQDLRDRPRHLDFGHLIIGLDARRSYASRRMPIPTQGGTGLEISTWLGDLGGGAAMLAYDRVSAPTTPAVTRFRGSDFGGSINLEGDVAGFLVGRNRSTTGEPTEPMFTSRGVAGALEDYVGASGPGAEWNARAANFLLAYGATFHGATCTNHSTLVDLFATRIEAFAVWYLLNRLRGRAGVNARVIRGASSHLHGASREVAEVFVDALLYARAHPTGPIEARGSGPRPSPPDSGNTYLNAAARLMEAAEIFE